MQRSSRYITLVALIALGLTRAARAHDTWVQTNTNLVRVGDAVHIDLCLGNHGNAHRDFKLASKLDLAGTALVVIAPDGKRYDLKDRLIDTGYTPKEGFWTAPFIGDRAGLYLVAQTSDTVVSYAPERAVKSAKTFFVASQSLDKPEAPAGAFVQPLGHPLEWVPLIHPVLPMGPGTTLRVRLLFQGKPLAGERVAFIPRGAMLKEGLDERFERVTDARGEVAFEPKEANLYLLVAHREAKEEGGTLDGRSYQSTKYGATLTVFVPQLCPCCGGG